MTAAADHLWKFNRTTGVTALYEYTDQRLLQETGLARPTRTHRGEVGLSMLRSLSRNRALSWTVGGGATHTEAISSTLLTPYSFVAPSGSASVRLDLNRTWGVSADYRRSVTMLDGVVFDTFLTDALSTTVGGDVGGGVSVAVSSALAIGQAQKSDNASYDSVMGTAQLEYEVADWCTVVSSYTYYHHHLRDAQAVASGFPMLFDRNSIRVGLSINLPIYGNVNPVAGN
jgi:hypothetical protein